MKVILKEKVQSVGLVGDTVNVSAGYARNYLIPNNLAVVASKSNEKFVEDQKRRLSKKIQEEKDRASEVKKKVDGLKLEFEKKIATNGKLYGAVSTNDIAKELGKLGHNVERRWITLDTPIKQLGDFTATVKLFNDIEASIAVNVVIDPKQAEEIKKKQELAAAAKKKAAEQAKAEENKEDLESEVEEKKED